MGSFGENLKREREARGIALQQISEETKIGIRQLQAIEAERLDQLPGGIFNKSFVRQYARYLGLDEERVLAEYLQLIGGTAEPPAAPSHVPLEERNLPAAGGYLRLVLTAVCLGIAVAGILYAIHQFTERRLPPGPAANTGSAASSPISREAPGLPAEQPPTANPAAANPSSSMGQAAEPSLQSPPEKSAFGPPAPAAVGGAPPPVAGPAMATQNRPAPAPAAAAEKPRADSGASEAAAGGLVLQIEARREVWLSIIADGQKQWQGNLGADRTRRVEARESVQLTVGDAGAVALSLNGKAMPPVGRAGEVKKLTISAKGLAETAP